MSIVPMRTIHRVTRCGGGSTHEDCTRGLYIQGTSVKSAYGIVTEERFAVTAVALQPVPYGITVGIQHSHPAAGAVHMRTVHRSTVHMRLANN